jgi:hypothetical protein
MVISINGKTADITMDNEKTIGEVMVGLEQWLTNSGHRLSGFSVDGEPVPITMIEEVFSRGKDSVETLDISTLSIADLTSMSLSSLLNDIDEFEKLEFENKENFFNEWKERAQVKFITEQIPDLVVLCANTFSRGDMLPNMLRSIIEEMLREVNDPVKEFESIEPLVNETCKRLIDLPLDIQTGKDAKAAQTIQVFSGITEKILRILGQLNIQGFLPQPDSEKPFVKIIVDFGDVVKELLEAYERQDTVLVGDLAEYEAAPKLKELFSVIMKKSRETADAQGIK